MCRHPFTALELDGEPTGSCPGSILPGWSMSTRSGRTIRIDSIHSRAICDEIGDRLREILDRQASELPPRLRYLVARLAEMDSEYAPSIVPCLEDMVQNQLDNRCREDILAQAELVD